jgi:hypothetical protein
MRRVMTAFGVAAALTVAVALSWPSAHGPEPVSAPAPAAPAEAHERASGTAATGSAAAAGATSTASPTAGPPSPPAASSPEQQPAITDAVEVYRKNPHLIPAFVEESKRQAQDLDKGERDRAAWQRCGWEYAERNGLEHQGVATVTFAYALQVTRGEARLLDAERIYGGDDELARCLRGVRAWMSQPFPAPGATDGTFRWRGPAEAVALGTDPLRPPSNLADGTER